LLLRGWSLGLLLLLLLLLGWSSHTRRHATTAHACRHATTSWHSTAHAASTGHLLLLLHAGLHLLHSLLHSHLKGLLRLLHDDLELIGFSKIELVESNDDVRILNAALLVVLVDRLNFSHLLHHRHTILRQLTHLGRDERASNL